MAVVIETTLGDITVDLFLLERPRASLNFLKLCKLKYYNFNLFHTIERGFIAQTGDPTGSRTGGESVYGVMEGPLKRYFEGEKIPKIKHTRTGLLSFVGNDEGMIGSQFFISLGPDLTYLDEKHCVFGEVMEGLDVLELLNETICDGDNRPYKDVRITHTIILNDPFSDPNGMKIPDRSPSPSAERLQGGRIAADEEIDDAQGKSAEEITEMLADREAKARATILEMVGDIPDADMAPPENVLFVCKLNPVTNDDDLEIIFSRFGKIVSCEVIRDKKSGDSLQYAFVEFDNPKSCEDAYFKMDNVLIDDRRIHVDFSQSVAKVKWLGKGRGVTTYDDQGRRTFKDNRNELGKGIYKRQAKDKGRKARESSRKRASRSRSPKKRSPSLAERRPDNRRSSSDRRHYSNVDNNRWNRPSDYPNSRDRDNRFQRNRYQNDARQPNPTRRRNEGEARHNDRARVRDDTSRRDYHSRHESKEVDRRQETSSRAARQSDSKQTQRTRTKSTETVNSELEHKKKRSKKSKKKRASSSSSDDSSSEDEKRKKKSKSKKKKRRRSSSDS